MRAFAKEAAEFLGNRSDQEIVEDRIRFLAITRAVEIVGEAAAQVPAPVQGALDDIDFKAAIGMRHRLIHGYGAIAAPILADTIRADFPPLIAALDAALKGALPDDPPAVGEAAAQPG